MNNDLIVSTIMFTILLSPCRIMNYDRASQGRLNHCHLPHPHPISYNIIVHTETIPPSPLHQRRSIGRHNAGNDRSDNQPCGFLENAVIFTVTTETISPVHIQSRRSIGRQGTEATTNLADFRMTCMKRNESQVLPKD